mmetsp:Transcript_103510/g.267720  ORF Transcript_103510/g.267720 Transcript_103510/m.267720 type:complete len:236 (+) Transcript_103510:1011-1718(+)
MLLRVADLLLLLPSVQVEHRVHMVMLVLLHLVHLPLPLLGQLLVQVHAQLLLQCVYAEPLPQRVLLVQVRRVLVQPRPAVCLLAARVATIDDILARQRSHAALGATIPRDHGGGVAWPWHRLLHQPALQAPEVGLGHVRLLGEVVHLPPNGGGRERDLILVLILGAVAEAALELAHQCVLQVLALLEVDELLSPAGRQPGIDGEGPLGLGRVEPLAGHRHGSRDSSLRGCGELAG